VRKNLLLLTGSGQDHLAAGLRAARAGSWFSEVVVHDFDSILGDAPAITGLDLREAGSKERLLNIATVVIDLTADEAVLLGQMSSNYRRQIRRAGDGEIVVQAHLRPSPDLMESFLTSLRNLADERGFRRPRSAATAAMFEQGDSVLFVAERRGAPVNFIHLYTADDTVAVFMSGVNIAPANDGSGKLIHWEAMRWLKARGYDWYDLGGVSSQRPDDGIFNFKRRFGGQVVSLGTEWRYVDRATRLSLALIGATRRAHASLRNRESGMRSERM
jgi:hypothetical protein